MSNITKTEADREAIVSALDQLIQTMDVMQQIVRRLRRSVDQANNHATLERQYRAVDRRQQMQQQSAPRENERRKDSPRTTVEQVNTTSTRTVKSVVSENESDQEGKPRTNTIVLH